MKRWIAVLLLGVLGIVGAYFASSASGASVTKDEVKCRKACVYDITARTKTREWSTPWAADQAETIAVVVFVDGHDLEIDEVNPCLVRFYGRGVAVRVSSCQDDAPLRVRVVAINDRPTKVRLWLKRIS